MSYGADLPDSEQLVNQHVEGWVQRLPELSAFLQTRVQLERDFSKKLSQAASSARLAAVKEAQDLTVDALYLKFLETQDLDARYRAMWAGQLAQTAQQLDSLGKRFDAVRKQHHAFANKLFAERDKAYDVRNASKQHYHSACDTLEAARQKKQASKDPQKANKAYDHAEQEMMNHKNQFLIDNDAANVAKSRLYSTDLPRVHDDFQILEQTVVSAMCSQLNSFVALNDDVLRKLQDNVGLLKQSIAAVDVVQDQQKFVNANKGQLAAYAPPPDLVFEPSPVWHDTPDMSTTPASIVYLNNVKLKNQTRLNEIGPAIEAKQREIGGLRNLRDAYEKDRNLGDPASVLENLFDTVHDATLLETQQSQLEAQIELIDENLGDDQANAVLSHHDLKSHSFVAPATCVVCDSSVWGKGLSCRACNVAVHSKCELKLPANCSSGGGGRSTGSTHSKVSRLRRSAGGKSTSSSLSARGSFESQPAATRASFESGTERIMAAAAAPSTSPVKMLYDYAAASEQEVTVQAGETVQIVEPDDSSGWIKVRTARGAMGLVPTSYTQTSSLPTTTGTVARRATALYDYEGRTADELSMREGDALEVVSGDAEGWTTVRLGTLTGLVPTTYIQMQ